MPLHRLSHPGFVAHAGTQQSSSDKPIQELRELLEAQEDSLDLAVHELRGPLGRIAAYLSMVGAGDLGILPESAREVVESASADTRLMARMVDRLAEAARLEGHTHHRPCHAQCNVGDVLASAISGVRAEASARRIRLSQRVADSDLEVRGNPDQLSAAVANLLSNSIKYSPEASTVTVQTATRHSRVAITVTDQGPGITAADAPLVFDKHYRASSITPGLGLGLYLVRRIVESHGGIVTLQSEPGQGATFTIVLPAVRSSRRRTSPSR